MRHLHFRTIRITARRELGRASCQVDRCLYCHTVKWDEQDPTKPVGLYWAGTSWSEEQCVQYPWTTSFDSTYSNEQQGPGSHASLQHQQPQQRSFTYAYGLINNERQDGFDWLADQVKAQRTRIGAKGHLVAITDYSNALKRAMDRVFPTVKQQLCIWHMNKNMKNHISKKWDASVLPGVALGTGY